MLIVITGPIASGKSTIGIELAGQLERVGVRAAVIDLDQVHDRLVAGGAPADASSWALARRDAAAEADALTGDGVAVVVAEGSFNLPTDREAFVTHLRPRSEPIFVTLQVSYEEALRRAAQDPTRGLSRDPRFLGDYFAGRRDAFASVPSTDVVIDTESTTAVAAAASLVDLIGSLVP